MIALSIALTVCCLSMCYTYFKKGCKVTIVHEYPQASVEKIATKNDKEIEQGEALNLNEAIQTLHDIMGVSADER